MFLLVQSKITPVLLIGATISGILAVYLIQLFTRKTVLKLDSAMALVIASFFGGALVIMTYIQGQPGANQAGLQTFLFGQASAMLRRDIYMMIWVSLAILILIILLWQPFKLLTFDRVFAQVTYKHAKFLNFLLSVIIVLTIMLGLESVGVILISSLLIAPSIAARQWSNRLSTVMITAGVMGAVSGTIGTTISSLAPRIPTGPSIVVVLSVITLFSLIFGPKNNFLNRRKPNYDDQPLAKGAED